jgi:hypothetical protein
MRIVINLNADDTWYYRDYHHDSGIVDYIGFDADDNLLYILRYIDWKKKFNSTFENGSMDDCKLYENNQVSGSCME